MGGIERRLQRLEQGGGAADSEARRWADAVSAAWAIREGRTPTTAPGVPQGQPPRPGGFLDTVLSAHERGVARETGDGGRGTGA